MFLKRNYLKVGVALLLLLSGCTLESPAEHMDKMQQVGKGKTTASRSKRVVAQTESVAHFLCSNNQEVRVSYIKNNKKTKKLEKIKVTHSGTTHTLSPVVSENGKKYTNIRWTWWEARSGQAYLIANPQKVLAEKCERETRLTNEKLMF